jgi:hypothetical protein
MMRVPRASPGQARISPPPRLCWKAPGVGDARGAPRSPKVAHAHRAHGTTTDRELDVSAMRAKYGPTPLRGRDVRNVSIHQAPREGKGPVSGPVQGRLDADRDACHTINAQRRGYEDEQVVASRGYHPHRSGHHDSSEDRSPSPDPPGSRVFCSRIRSAPFL